MTTELITEKFMKEIRNAAEKADEKDIKKIQIELTRIYEMHKGPKPMQPSRLLMIAYDEL